MREQYDTRKLEVDLSQDQSVQVGDEIKARVMAHEENVQRDFAKLYDDYRADPSAFIASHPKLPSNELEHLRELETHNVPPDYLRRYGELRAEVQGDIYDFRQTIRNYAEADLLRLRDSVDLSLDFAIWGRLLAEDGAASNQLDVRRLNNILRVLVQSLKLEALDEEIELRRQPR